MATILIVDDEPMQIRLLRAIMEETDHRVLEATGGQQALDVMAQQSCDLIITDCDMPGMNGLELAQRVLAYQPDFPILFLTGAMSDDRQLAIEAMGCQGITKPYSPLRLLALVNQLLS